MPEEKKFDDLRFVRINQPDLMNFIPRELFEQVKDHTFNIDKIYELAPTFISNPLVRFYALVDEASKVKGILWAFINLLLESIQINVLSIDKEYQFDNALEKTLEFIKSWQGKDENLKIEFITTRPLSYKKIGYKESKRKIMEKE